MITKIGTITLALMQERGIQSVGYGDHIILELIAARAKCRRMTPKERVWHILRALDRDDRFSKTMVKVAVPVHKKQFGREYYFNLQKAVCRFEICDNNQNKRKELTWETDWY